MSTQPRLMVIAPRDDGDLAAARALIEAYARSLDFNLCFQGFDAEMAGFPGMYAPPHGALRLGLVDGVPLGVVALKRLDDGICEMKRLYVAPAARGTGLGRQLADSIVAAGRALGYRAVRLDTIGTMAAAISLYRALGFRPIPDYNGNPLPGAQFFEFSYR